MSDLLDLVVNTFPANNDVGVPLQSNLTVTLSGLDYDSDSLKDGLFVEGPDTDQFVGPDLEIQTNPQNISQGDLDDFLQSPGYQGIVKGVTTVTGIAGNTVITFDPEKPLAPNIQYIVNLTGVLDSLLADIDGFVSFSFESGTGSIEVIPSTISTSILSAGIPESSLPSSEEDLKVTSTLPADRAIQQPTDLGQIVITFNKNINPASFDADDVIVRTTPASDHPNASRQSLGDLAKVIEVAGNKLTIKI